MSCTKNLFNVDGGRYDDDLYDDGENLFNGGGGRYDDDLNDGGEKHMENDVGSICLADIDDTGHLEVD